jgi:hypothetical protein
MVLPHICYGELIRERCFAGEKWFASGEAIFQEIEGNIEWTNSS